MPLERNALSIVVLSIAGVLALSGSEVSAQTAERPRVYLDCQGPGCDFNYFRTEVDWVVWVRDQADAHVHIILTTQNTGAGGREYVLDFIGRGQYARYSEQSLYRTLPTDTQREELDGVALMLSVGLAHFATQSGFRGLIQVAPLGAPAAEGFTPADRVVSQEEADDPWNLWVFRVNANGNYNGQSSRSDWRIGAGFNGSRVSPTWKQSYNGNFNRNAQRIEFDNRPAFEDDRYDWGFTWRVSYALAEHVSAGVSGNIGRNTRNNQEIWGQFNPAIEYSVFPYEEATRRSLTVFYEIGPVYRHYFEETLLGEDAELRAEQALSVSFSQRQPWGSAFVSLRGSTYMHDLGTNNVSLDGNLSFRVARGLDLNLGGSYSRVRDQIFLAGGDLTEEERLLRLQQEQTDYQARMNFGFSYQFGSIFNNVVNNRF
jgi:hypothetical protein